MNKIIISVEGNKTICSEHASGKNLLSIIREEYDINASDSLSVRIESGTASPITEIEKEALSSSMLQEGIRLAKETYPMGNLSFTING